jgi:hypothetical protein
MKGALGFVIKGAAEPWEIAVFLRFLGFSRDQLTLGRGSP